MTFCFIVIIIYYFFQVFRRNTNVVFRNFLEKKLPISAYDRRVTCVHGGCCVRVFQTFRPRTRLKRKRATASKQRTKRNGIDPMIIYEYKTTVIYYQL